MLIKNFYTVQNLVTGENKFTAVIGLNPGHEVYDGHFPGQPVVPGVIQIQLLRELAEEVLLQKLFINQVVSAKYLNMIVPGRYPLLIELVYKSVEEGYSINGTIKNDERIFSKIKLKVIAE